MPPIVPTGAPDSSRGNSATVTMSREDLMAKTATQLKALLKERGLPAGDAAKSTLVDRFLNGKKKAPKTSTERSQASRKTRSQTKKKEDTDRNKQQHTASRANRSEAKKEEDRASNAMGMAALRGDENHRLKENNRERLRKKDWRKVPKNWEKEKTCQNERRADGTSDLDKIKDLTRGDLTTRLWKRPGFDAPSWWGEARRRAWEPWETTPKQTKLPQP